MMPCCRGVSIKKGMDRITQRPYQGGFDQPAASRIYRDLQTSIPALFSSQSKSESKPAHALEYSTATMMRKQRCPGARPLRVCIVGAGVAGLRAANVLRMHGVNVTIYEARDRIGGRVLQNSDLGHLVDLGPNWIHGTVNNPILDLAKSTKTTLHLWDENQAVFDENGTPVPVPEIVESWEDFWGIMADAFKHSNEHSPSIRKETSLADFVQEAALEKYNGHAPALVAQKKRMLSRESDMWGFFIGSATARQSLKFLWMEECLEGENPFVAGTFSQILEAIVKPVRDCVKLNHFVKRIRQVDAEASHDGRVAVETCFGVDEFDQVIVTSPLGCLKNNTIKFEPQLPHRLRKAIQSIGYGSLDKVYVTFPKAWWSNSKASMAKLPSSSGSQELPHVTANTVPLHQNSSSSTTKDGFPGFAHWLKPSYAKSTNPHGWNLQAVNLAALPASCAHPTLLYYTFGECSSHIAQIVKASPKDKVEAVLDEFFRPYYSLLPNYDAQSPDCKPSGLLATAWAADELAGYGSYCNFQVGLEEGDKDVEAMRHGLPERGIWFAGEHTAPFVALGTLTGAYWSGEKVAQRIVDVYGLTELELHVNGHNGTL